MCSDNSKGRTQATPRLLNSLFALVVILGVIGLAGCSGWLGVGGGPGSSQMDSAEKVLVDFFQALSQGDYGAAADLYGGSYEVLISYNPDLDPADFSTLWERACAVNGFQCLQIGEVVAVERVDESTFTFTVQFLTSDGKIFLLGPCCGAGETSVPPTVEFDFRVSQQGSGKYMVVDLPVYIP